MNNEELSINTFKELYDFLQSYKEENIFGWLKDSWQGKDKQESLLRLFAGLKLIEKLDSYDVCKGNFNLKKIIKHSSLKDIFYNEKNELIKLKDKGDSSDLTCISKNNKKHLLLTTSKNLNKANIGKMDIDKILTNFRQYDNYSMSLCICIRNANDFKNMINRIEITNKELKTFINKDDTIIIDWSDLNQAYCQFKLIFNDKKIDSIFSSDKNILCLKIHQHLGVFKTLNMKNIDKKKKILWGHIQRSGKSYIIGGCIIQDCISTKDECNYLVITTAPNETIEQQRKVFNCFQLQEFNVIVLGENKKPTLAKKNIIICSKQFLQTKIDTVRSIAWLKKLSFDIRFIDESHNGGTTELAKKTLEYYGKNSFTVQITATYSKPINDYNIPKDSWILWDLEDIKFCKNIDIADNYDKLIEKHGEEIKNIIKKYTLENIIFEYSKYPELWILTDEINPEIVSKILERTKDNNYGWSTDACFMLKQCIEDGEIITKEEFQNESETLKLWYRIFGKKDDLGIAEKDYPDEKVFLKRIEKICKNPSINSRFIGDSEEPMIVMAFLPQNNIDKISKATINLLQKHNIIPEYEIIGINSKTSNNPKQTIEEARIKAYNGGKKGVLVLSGKQCSLGVSIDNCDIVLLLNNNMGFDMIYQMMFRCMTEGKNKKCGFVIDLNIHRVIETSVINYASLINPENHPKEVTKYILQERLINLNGDHWMPSFGNEISKINSLCENVYEIYSSNTENALNHFLNRLCGKKLLLTKEEQKIFNAMFGKVKMSKELIDKLIVEDELIKKGEEKTAVKIDNPTTPEKEVDEKQINYMDILKHIIPLICLLTIHNKETSFVKMFDIIEKDKYIYNIMVEQTKGWWGKDIDEKIIKKFISVYIKYMKDDKETNQIIRTIKEIFVKNVNNSKTLGQLIDKYLVPQELEKKTNAEVSTPYKLRQEMLDKMPEDFWATPKKVFEPCAGKGGFVVDIIDRFMIGLKDIILDEKERYKVIVEECLYFSDINPTNIFICRLLVDPEDKYKINYNEGNTLELDIKKKWKIDGFDAVIGNPPYNIPKEDKLLGGYGGRSLWDKFVIYCTDKCLNIRGLMLFVHPPSWRKPEHYLWNKMSKENQILYLKILTESDSSKFFKCSTIVDYYLLEKQKQYTLTIVDGQDERQYKVDLSKWNFLPGGCIDLVEKILGANEVIYSRTLYGTDKKNILPQNKKEPKEEYYKRCKDEKYNCPVIHNMTKEYGNGYVFSNEDKGHFKIKKVVLSFGRHQYPYNDYKGEYGMSQICYGLEIKNKEEGDSICRAINSEKFKNILKYTKWSTFQTDWRMFKYFKKDFWKDFI